MYHITRTYYTGVSYVDYWKAVKSSISIDWHCNACTFTDEASSTPLEPESTVDDTATPTMERDSCVPTDDLENSLDDPLYDKLG